MSNTERKTLVDNDSCPIRNGDCMNCEYLGNYWENEFNGRITDIECLYSKGGE